MQNMKRTRSNMCMYLKTFADWQIVSALRGASSGHAVAKA